MKIRTCHRCGEKKPLAAFPVNPPKPEGRAVTCTACVNERVRMNYALAKRRQGSTILQRYRKYTRPTLEAMRCATR